MNSTKKRRVDEGGSGGGEQSNGGGLVQDELKALSSHMTNMMAMMSSMQGEIARLTNESNQMKLKMEAMQRTQIANHNTEMSTVFQMKNTIQTITGLQHVHLEQITHNTKSVNSRFDVAYNKQKYHEELLKNQQWKYSAPRLSTGYWNGLGENEGAVAWEFLKQIKQRTKK